MAPVTTAGVDVDVGSTTEASGVDRCKRYLRTSEPVGVRPATRTSAPTVVLVVATVVPPPFGNGVKEAIWP